MHTFADATPATLMIFILLMRGFHALYITKNPHEIYRYARNVIQNTISEDTKVSNCNSGNNDTMPPVKSTDSDSTQCDSDNEDKNLAED